MYSSWSVTRFLETRPWRHVLQILTLSCLTVLVVPQVFADPDGEPLVKRADVQSYIDELVADEGFERAALEEIFAQVSIRQDIIAKISKPAETVWTWGRYKKHLVDDDRVRQGVLFWRDHRDTLERAHQTYGVAPEIVLAILGIETRYGRITGNYPVVEALSTLGFGYPPRAKFFRKELTQSLILAREEGKDPKVLMGSYAGAMGYGQFIPSSFRHYAVDFDNDGLRDIWQNPVDAIGSIANYFAKHKWAGTGIVAMQVKYVATHDLIKFDKGIELNSTVGALRQAGMQLSDTQLTQVDDQQSAKLFQLEAQGGKQEFWLAMHDFYVITRYNRSHLYALAVHHLSQELKARL